MTFDGFKTVIIDAGHGGEDGGAVGVSSVLEKELNLEISNRFENLLNLFGINTGMIRRDDLSLGNERASLRQKKAADIKKRVELVNNIPDSVLISIHQNSFPQDSSCKGAQVFFSDYNAESRPLAEIIQDTLKETLDKSNTRKSKPADKSIYILNNVKCPAVLVECGFLTNPQEAKLLCDDGYQKKIAVCLAGALVKNSV